MGVSGSQCLMDKRGCVEILTQPLVLWGFYLICLSHHLQHEGEGEPDEAGYD